ncbi:Clan SC, family S9, unassigned serine peptidase [Histomonas meleagridis]|uniref:Clan SC, family S9, unassigned serine peptidase n=1 Tax=Histomonas meleagridis TaxID=135588 RepID=UPI00355966CF|nr:Clan SC, family S9, unassigned serine peptidase [Histomonas meleagridis]KAH0797019.1 Clan SC, family S9, unassigned serine peptidase [Histomonas meleagridis]
MNQLGNLAEKALNAIVRPPRQSYNLGSVPVVLKSNGTDYIRHPVNFLNPRNQKIIGSVYVESTHDINEGMPCVIYMHGNASSQNEGLFLIPNLCKYGIAVFLYDCAGCGNSGGDYISLGYYESKDVSFIITHLKNSFNLGPFVIWGRSMGAISCIMADHTNVKGIIADSTFSSLSSLCNSIAVTIGVPKIFIPSLLWWLKYHIKELAGFDIESVSPIEQAKRPRKAPAVIGHATDDKFIPFAQGKLVYNSYSNKDKQFVEFSGGHNGARPSKWYNTCFNFIFRVLNIKVNNFKRSKFNGLKEISHFTSYQEMIDFAAKHGGEEKTVMLLRSQSKLDCEYSDGSDDEE